MDFVTLPLCEMFFVRVIYKSITLWRAYFYWELIFEKWKCERLEHFEIVVDDRVYYIQFREEFRVQVFYTICCCFEETKHTPPHKLWLSLWAERVFGGAWYMPISCCTETCILEMKCSWELTILEKRGLQCRLLQPSDCTEGLFEAFGLALVAKPQEYSPCRISMSVTFDPSILRGKSALVIVPVFLACWLLSQTSPMSLDLSKANNMSWEEKLSMNHIDDNVTFGMCRCRKIREGIRRVFFALILVWKVRREKIAFLLFRESWNRFWLCF